MSIKDRLQMVMKMHNLTNAGFADRVGVQRSSISHIMAGRNKPSLDFIQKTLTAFPRVNAQWLITGKQESANKPGPGDSKNRIEVDSSEAQQESTDDKYKKPSKTIERIVVFYTDGTYEETLPVKVKKQ